jgi:hypothetical protein
MYATGKGRGYQVAAKAAAAWGRAAAAATPPAGKQGRAASGLTAPRPRQQRQRQPSQRYEDRADPDALLLEGDETDAVARGRAQPDCDAVANNGGRKRTGGGGGGGGGGGDSDFDAAKEGDDAARTTPSRSRPERTTRGRGPAAAAGARLAPSGATSPPPSRSWGRRRSARGPRRRAGTGPTPRPRGRGSRGPCTVLHSRARRCQALEAPARCGRLQQFCCRAARSRAPGRGRQPAPAVQAAGRAHSHALRGDRFHFPRGHRLARWTLSPRRT